MPNLQSTAIQPFSLCSNLSYLELGLPEITLTSVFYPQPGLRNLVLPECTLISGSHTFRSCADLISLSAPKLISCVGTGAFEHCSSLTDIYAPNLEVISYATFKSCYNLSKAIFSKATYIGR
jgi:hypothetical protein